MSGNMQTDGPVRANPVTGRLQREGRKLLHQQCWVWGRDVCNRDGNLLEAYGFEKMRCPLGKDVSSQYTLQLAPEQGLNGWPGVQVVRLWGYGIFFGTHDPHRDAAGAVGLYLNRYEFVARSVPSLPEFCYSEQMAHCKRARDLSLLPAAFRWIAAYERWVLDTFHAAYRQQCLLSWSKRGIAPETMPARWEALARDVEASMPVQHPLEACAPGR